MQLKLDFSLDVFAKLKDRSRFFSFIKEFARNSIILLNNLKAIFRFFFCCLSLEFFIVMAYMEMFGNCSHANDNEEFLRHSVHMVSSHWPSASPGLPTTQSCSFSHTSHSSRSSISQTHNLIIPTSSGDARYDYHPYNESKI